MCIVKTTEEFDDWLNRLRKNDFQLSHRVVQRVKRMAMGNLGDVKAVGGKVSEARIFSRPAVRLYFTMLDGIVIILLCGGGKNDQQADIAKAQQLAAQLFEEVRNETQEF